METFALAGLAIIALSWLIQMMSIWRGKHGLRKSFVLMYGLGAALTVIASSEQGFSSESWLHLVILLLVGLVYLKHHH